MADVLGSLLANNVGALEIRTTLLPPIVLTDPFGQKQGGSGSVLEPELIFYSPDGSVLLDVKTGPESPRQLWPVAVAGVAVVVIAAIVIAVASRR